VSTTFEGLVPGTYQIDPSHSEVGFTVRHLVGKVRGQFRSFEGTLEIAAEPLDSSTTAVIDLNSVDTRNTDRDNHLRSGDFFGVDTNPTMKFVSTGVYDKGDKIVFSGDLTIKDVTKSLDLELEYNGTGDDPWGGTRVAFEATATISRKEWGIDFNLPSASELVVIGDKVNIVLAVEAVLQADAS